MENIFFFLKNISASYRYATVPAYQAHSTGNFSLELSGSQMTDTKINKTFSNVIQY